MISYIKISFMKEDIEALIDVAESLHVQYNINSQLMKPRKNTGRKKEDLSLDDYIKIYTIISKINHSILTPVAVKDLPEENRKGLLRKGLLCGAGRSSFGITYNGNICPCLSLEEFQINPFIRGFDDAWKQVIAYADNYPLPLECSGCVYQKVCLSCVALHKGTTLQGHCDNQICERTKRLVQEGFVPLPVTC